MPNPSNLLIMNIAGGEEFEIPSGFLFASIYPSSGATFTITNSLTGEIVDVSEVTTPAIDTSYTFPNAPSLDGWAAHTIAATGGSVLITYSSGL